MFTTLRYKGNALMVCEKTIREMKLGDRRTIASEEEFFLILESNALNMIAECEEAIKCIDTGRYN